MVYTLLEIVNGPDTLIRFIQTAFVLGQLKNVCWDAPDMNLTGILRLWEDRCGKQSGGISENGSGLGYYLITSDR